MSKQRSIKYQAFPVVWIALGVAALILAPPITATSVDLTALVLWTAMITIAAMSPVPLPRGGRFLLSPAVDLGALLVFGPAAAAWYGVVSRLIAGAAERWSPFDRTLSRVGSVPFAMIAGGFVYQAIDGPNPWPASSIHFVGFAAAAATYSVILGGARTLSRSLEMPGRGIAVYVRWWAQESGLKVVLVPFAALLAATQIQIGVYGVALFLLPLLLVRYAIKLWIDTRMAHMETVRLLVGALDARDPFTNGYSLRVARRSMAMARHMQIPEKDVEDIEYAALLHDIGRTATLRDILNKTGRLTEDEMEKMQAHPRIGFEMVRRLGLFANSAEMVLTHHERPDGLGYPLGLKGPAVPVGSRIIFVASAYDAMVCDRPYRQGLSPEEAVEELLRNSGTQFFPEVVEALIAILPQEDMEEVNDIYAAASGRPQAAKVKPLPEKKNRSFTPASPLVIPLPGPEVSELHVDLGANLRMVCAGASDVGCVREHNEDAMLLSGNVSGALLVVADGVGGAAAGEVASRLAVETADSLWKGAADAVDPVELGVEANSRIMAHAGVDAECEGMATTFTAVAVSGNRLSMSHVGDSRAYLVREGKITRLTQDHTLHAELQQASGGKGALSGTEHILTRSLGSDANVEFDRCQDVPSLEPGDLVVVCSDGLSGPVDDAEIGDVVSHKDPLAACRKLVDLARDRGGPDNITVVVSRVEAA